MLASVLGTLVLSLGVAACGAGSGSGGASSSSTASTDTTATVTTTATASGTVPTAGANPSGATSPPTGTTSPTSTKPSGGGGLTTGAHSDTTGSGSGSSSGSGGAGLGGGDTTSSTSTTCTGHDCQGSGAPLAPGAIKPTGKSCPSGYIYLPPQDGGPALCIPVASSGTGTAGGADFDRQFPDGTFTTKGDGSEITGGFNSSP